MCGFRPSASTLATWLSAYYFSASYCEEELHQERSFLTLLLQHDDGVKMFQKFISKFSSGGLCLNNLQYCMLICYGTVQSGQ